MRKLALAIFAISVAGAGYYALKPKGSPLAPSVCREIENDTWPTTVPVPAKNDFPRRLDGLFDIRTGQSAEAACAKLLDRGFELTSQTLTTQNFLLARRPSGYDRVVVFQGEHTPPGTPFKSLATVKLEMGTPATGHGVESIVFEYFFADKNTPEPGVPEIREAILELFGPPTSDASVVGVDELYWVISSDGLSSTPHKVACDIQHRGGFFVGLVFDEPLNPECHALLRVTFGGNMGTHQTARYLRLEFFDNMRIWQNRSVDRSIRDQYG